MMTKGRQTTFLAAIALLAAASLPAHAAVVSKTYDATGVDDSNVVIDGPDQEAVPHSYDATVNYSAGEIIDISKVWVEISFAKYDTSSGDDDPQAYVGPDDEYPDVAFPGPPQYNEMSFILTAPFGHSVVLVPNEDTNSLESGEQHNPDNDRFNNFNGTIIFDDDDPEGNGPIRLTNTDDDSDRDRLEPGTYQPFDYDDDTDPQRLSSFADGDPGAAGDWTLTLEDSDEFDPLSFHSFTLNIEGTPETTVIPTPAALPAGLALLGVGAVRRGRRRRR